MPVVPGIAKAHAIAALDQRSLKRDARITLRIVDEPEGRKLNNEYRGRDYATNVLTFVYDEVQNSDVTTDETAGHPTDEATSQSAKSPNNGDQVDGYKQPEDGCQVVGYSHSTKLSKVDSQVAGSSALPFSGEGPL